MELLPSRCIYISNTMQPKVFEMYMQRSGDILLGGGSAHTGTAQNKTPPAPSP